MFWLTAFLDLPAAMHDAGLSHWRAVTGYDVSEPRGASGEFRTLVPPTGDAHLRVQRTGENRPRIHLDVHVDDVEQASAEARRSGATEVLANPLGYTVMASPGGLPFCFVRHRAGEPAEPATWQGGLSSVVDQVSLDIPGEAYEDECRFWQALTGWELRQSTEHVEFRRLIRPPGQPLQLLLQRLDEETGRVRAHLDLAATDRAAETERHVTLGAEVLDVRSGWTVLSDPTGSAYCITDRQPGIRVLDQPVRG